MELSRTPSFSVRRTLCGLATIVSLVGCAPSVDGTFKREGEAVVDAHVFKSGLYAHVISGAPYERGTYQVEGSTVYLRQDGEAEWTPAFTVGFDGVLTTYKGTDRFIKTQ